MIPAVTDFLPRRRPAPPVEGYRVFGITSHGSTGRQVSGPLPEWPADWAAEGRYPLDPAVFGDKPLSDLLAPVRCETCRDRPPEGFICQSCGASGAAA